MIFQHNALTGKTIEREATAKELAQMEADAVENAAKEAEKQAKAETKTSAIAKLAALGLTEDEAKAIIG
jgi:hypothetical protein